MERINRQKGILFTVILLHLFVTEEIWTLVCPHKCITKIQNTQNKIKILIIINLWERILMEFPWVIEVHQDRIKIEIIKSQEIGTQTKAHLI